ncbi:NADH-quinone oxidoreductase domain protein [Mycobacterium ulcerans str. Harvey]|uniref:NADH-quinone oxidoreductase domain protein n=1 Tax=Mycobacterium ulcerans str. Harvey TaxID=1299332 RepID=A0ABN0RAQ0_MYCUL|nr:NADH-quinone oxidoreductase domain protein [Mycobacterium ulcerans str. Harvey]
MATVPGGLSAAARLADSTGARLAWVPRRAGERGALEAGALPTLLPAAVRWPMTPPARRFVRVARFRLADRPWT